LLKVEVRLVPTELTKALARGRVRADAEMADSLYRRGLGYEHLATKIFMPAGATEPVYAPYVEHYPPDTPAALGWLSRRQPALWREKQQVDITLSPVLLGRHLVIRRRPASSAFPPPGADRPRRRGARGQPRVALARRRCWSGRCGRRRGNG
jgi:hypothetical protein